jgi:hypothetical protein
MKRLLCGVGSPLLFLGLVGAGLALRPSPPSCCASPLASCSGSASCSACKNCRYCAHCKGGGTCGVCSRSTATVTPPAPATKPAAPSVARPSPPDRLAVQPPTGEEGLRGIATKLASLDAGHNLTSRDERVDAITTLLMSLDDTYEEDVPAMTRVVLSLAAEMRAAGVKAKHLELLDAMDRVFPLSKEPVKDGHDFVLLASMYVTARIEMGTPPREALEFVRNTLRGLHPTDKADAGMSQAAIARAEAKKPKAKPVAPEKLAERAASLLKQAQQLDKRSNSQGREGRTTSGS